MALPKANRLKDRKDFELVFKKGNAVKGNFLFIKAKDNDRLLARFGFVVPAKIIPKAVDRNRIKRVFSSMAQILVGKGFRGYDVLIILNKKGHESVILTELTELLAKLK